MTTINKLTNIQKIINARNKKFNSAKNNAERRVLIAKDVIAQIKTNKIIPESGVFTSFRLHDNRYLYFLDIKESEKNDVNFTNKGIREAIFDNTIAECQCCALGSLMTSCTLYNNNYKFEDVITPETNIFGGLGEYIFKDGENPKNGLTKYFSRSQLKLIEIAFESGGGFFDNYSYRFNKPERKASSMFSNDFSPKDRLIAIMKNIIKNKGTFVPTGKDTVYGNL